MALEKVVNMQTPFPSQLMFTDGDLVGLAGVYLYVGLVILLAAKWKLIRNAKMHRKFIHIMVGNIVFIWWVFDSSYVMAFLAAAPFIPLLILASPHSSVKKLKQSFIGTATGEGHDYGLVYYAISWTFLAFFLFDHRMIASIAIVSMAYGDGMGGLIGKRFGKHRILGMKTLEGTVAVFLATAISSLTVILFYQYLSSSGLLFTSSIVLTAALVMSLVLGGIVAIVELITPGAIDNLVIPMGVAGILLLVGMG
jgi:phytol kinase